jgi:aminopeptidase N
LSLKEGLTVFRDQAFSADMRSRAVKRIEDVKMLRGRQFMEDGGPLAHPVQPQSYITIDNFYTATVYEKGSEIIGMLKTLVGDEGYRKTTDLYFDRHDGQAATVEDWVKCFEDANGRDLKQFRLWYSQAGTPIVTVTGGYDPAKKLLILNFKQTLAPTPGQPEKKPMHIPIRMGFVRNNGSVMPVTLEGDNATGPDERVIELTQAEQNFTFVGVDEPPLLSLNRHFSAPIHIAAPLNRKARAQLMASDPDSFNRWESGQALSSDILLHMAAAAQKGAPLQTDPSYIAAIGEVLKRAEDDPAFAALMLNPPSEGELAIVMLPADPDAIHAARVALIREVATAHKDAFAALYKKYDQKGPYDPGADAAGKRALRNACLRYLTAADDEAAATLADAHYRGASNMTDMIVGLAALSRMPSAKRVAAFADFHDRFKSDPLVIDKWMSLQALSCLPDTIETVRGLMKHPAFDMRNPNRVRSAIAAFAMNPLRFHAADGAGYKLVGEIIATMDKINPQVSARLTGAFETWRRYDPARQALMRGVLETIARTPGLSPNLFEVAGKMLG